MKALILAAGLGTRLGQLTIDRPKALVDIDGICMLERLLIKLKSVGIVNILINVHHHADLIKDFISKKDWKGLNIEISDEREQLLDTGGAIFKAKQFFDGDENILVHNVDVITEVDFSKLEKQHIKNNSLASLCVRNRSSSRGLLFDNENKLCGWTNNLKHEFKWVINETENYNQKAYSGVYIASPGFANKLPFSGSFSIIDAWLKIAETENIFAYDDKSANWFDLGTTEKIKNAEIYLRRKEHSKRFLEKVASELRLKSQDELINTAIILPNKRSVIFLKKYFNDGRVNPIWLPDFLSIDEFMEDLAGMSKADPLNLYFDLYRIHLKREGKMAKSTESFLSWAPMIIRDFNDIDLYLTKAADILRHITEARALKEWNLDGQEMTDLQKSYIDFYQSLYGYYEDLKDLMLENANAYTGFIYRYCSENIESLTKKIKWKTFVFAGFNALSPSEENVFGFIKSNYTTSIYFDADDYYINKQDNIPLQEAGFNLKHLINKWKLPKLNFLTNRLVNDNKQITFHEAQGQLSQVKLAGNLLQRRLDNEDGKSNIDLISETAIVLANENLLLPLLSSLPETYNDGQNKLLYNVTLGYPITYSPLKGFINDWFELLINCKINSSNQFRTQSIINLFLNNILISCINENQRLKIKSLSSSFIANNISYIYSKELLKLFNFQDNTDKDLFDLLFNEIGNVNKLLNNLVDLLLFLDRGLDSSNAKNAILKEQVILLLKISKRFSVSMAENIEQLDIKTFSSLFFQLLTNYEISLKGEPLSGIQIMGMLETRTLDFKNIILISANEGIIPKSGISDSFIPFDIRHAYGLPLPKDKNGVLSYHFFRLLQYAENIDIIYDASSEGLGVGEPSRFLRQIELELCKVNKNIILKKNSLILPSSIESKEINISKSDETLNTLRKKASIGFSPSALNSYISCKLKFYFRYVLKLEKENEIEASVESNTFGSIIHDTLEEIYLPFKDQLINTKQLSQSLKNLDNLLLKYFIKHYKTKNFKQGKNLLIWEVSKKYIKNFILSEIKELEGKTRTILGLEEKIKLKIRTNTNEVSLNGIIDRIDSDDGGRSIRIVDYKTGKVIAGDLKPKNLNLLLTDTKYAKAFQLIFYKYLYLVSLNKTQSDDIKTGIISIRNLNAGFLEFSLKDETENIIEEFEIILKSLIDEIFDPEINFTQTEDIDICNYCDYKNICNR